MKKLWHNEEAQALANRIKGIVRAWDRRDICPAEFLNQLEDAVREARTDRERRIRDEPSDP